MPGRANLLSADPTRTRILVAQDGIYAGPTIWLNWSDSAADPYKKGPEARRSPEARTGLLPFGHCSGTAMNEKSWSERVAYLSRLAIGCLSLTLNAPVSAQTPPTAPIDSPFAATSTATETTGPPPSAVTPVPRLGPGSEAVTGSGVPAYKLLRYNEDYSYLKDPDRRTDFWDPIKYIPIGDREDWYVSFGAQLRPWFQFYNNFNFGTTPGPNAFLTQRYLFHGDFHFGPNIRFFGQLVSGLENGRIGGPLRDIDENVLRRPPGVPRSGPRTLARTIR